MLGGTTNSRLMWYGALSQRLPFTVAFGCNYWIDLIQCSAFCRRAVDARALHGTSKTVSTLR